MVAERRGLLIVLFACACSGEDAPEASAVAPGRAEEAQEAPQEAPSSAVDEAPEPAPQLSTLEPADHSSATRPSSWPCRAIRYVSGDTTQIQVRIRYRYEGPAECQTPPDLHLVGCPTRAEVRNPATDARSHDFTFRYGADGRMASYRVTSVDGERTLSTARLLYDDETGRLARVEESHTLRGTRSYQWLSEGEVRVTEEGGLPDSHWIHRRDADGRPSGAERVLRSNVIERRAFVFGDGDPPETEVDMATHYLAGCEDA
jgi:hypothetical protein